MDGTCPRHVRIPAYLGSIYCIGDEGAKAGNDETSRSQSTIARFHIYLGAIVMPA